MPRKSYRKKHLRKHQRGGGCGCGGTAVLGFPQSGGQMNSVMNDVPMDVPRNTSMNANSNPYMNAPMNAPRNTNMNAPRNTNMNAPRNTNMNAPRNTNMNAPRNTGTALFNSGVENNNPFLSSSNIMGGGFLGMFDSQQQQQQNAGISPQNVVSQPRIANQSTNVNARMSELENRLKKLEVGGSFFGGRRLRRKSRSTRKHKSRKH